MAILDKAQYGDGNVIYHIEGRSGTEMSVETDSVGVNVWISDPMGVGRIRKSLRESEALDIAVTIIRQTSYSPDLPGLRKL